MTMAQALSKGTSSSSMRILMSLRRLRARVSIKRTSSQRSETYSTMARVGWVLKKEDQESVNPHLASAETGKTDSFSWIATKSESSSHPFSSFLNRRRMSCRLAAHQRYCCLSRSSLPASLSSFGYSARVMVSAELRERK